MARYNPKTYVITSAQCRNEDADSIINEEFYAALEIYCKDRDAELLIMPMAGRTIHDDVLEDKIRKHLLRRDKNLNDKIKVSNYSILPQQIIPVTGLGRFTQSDVTTIFASPKQFYKVIPNSNDSLPKVLMTTGAVTHPNYKEDRIGKIAAKDHVYGAIVVETESPTIYHYRQLTADKNGEFVDLGVKYSSSKKTESSNLEALVLGDWHVGDTDPKVRAATIEIIKEYRPKRIIFHDFFNGHSVNHHENEKLITRAMAYAQGRALLKKELMDNSQELHAFRKIAGDEAEIVIVAANHHEFLDKYLQKGKYLEEDHNWQIGHELALACYNPLNPKLRIKNPLKEGLLRCGGIPENTTFLERNQDYKVLGFQLGAHGDKGGNGARASVKGLEDAYGKSISGHGHTPEILRNTFRAGTSTYLSLSYNDGPSSWMNTHALLWENGRVQLVNIIDGKWRRK